MYACGDFSKKIRVICESAGIVAMFFCERSLSLDLEWQYPSPFAEFAVNDSFSFESYDLNFLDYVQNDMCARSSAAMASVKYQRDIQYVTSVSIILKN